MQHDTHSNRPGNEAVAAAPKAAPGEDRADGQPGPSRPTGRDVAAAFRTAYGDGHYDVLIHRSGVTGQMRLVVGVREHLDGRDPVNRPLPPDATQRLIRNYATNYSVRPLPGGYARLSVDTRTDTVTLRVIGRAQALVEAARRQTRAIAPTPPQSVAPVRRPLGR